MLRYRLRTLLIVLGLAPPVLALAWLAARAMFRRLFQSGIEIPVSVLVLGAIIVVIAAIATWFSFATERRFRQEIASREPLDDAEFLHQFYANPDVPADWVLRLRPIYCSYFEIELGLLRPTDKPPEMADLDTTGLVRRIEQEFGIDIPDQDAENIDGSFDAIVRYLAKRAATSQVKTIRL